MRDGEGIISSLSIHLYVLLEGIKKNVGTTDDDTTYYVRYASQRSVIMTYDPARHCRSQLVM